MNNVNRSGRTKSGIQRFLCKRPAFHITTFMLEYQNKGCESGIPKKLSIMTINGSGIHDTARVLDISKGTVIGTLNTNCIF